LPDQPRLILDDGLIRRAEAFGLNVDAAIAGVLAPLSSQTVGQISYYLAIDPADPDEFLFIVTVDDDGEPRIIPSCWRLRGELVRRVGTDQPLLVLQEFAQEVGEILEIGDQRNRFVYAERVSISESEYVRIQGTRLNSSPEIGRLIGAQPGGRYTQDHQMELGGPQGHRFADVRYAYCIRADRYREWLAGEHEAIPEYHRVFISYGEPDSEFALKLRNELTRYGVDCWLYQLDATDGRRSWEEITEEIHQRDRTIIICSATALVREGSLKEIETSHRS